MCVRPTTSPSSGPVGPRRDAIESRSALVVGDRLLERADGQSLAGGTLYDFATRVVVAAAPQPAGAHIDIAAREVKRFSPRRSLAEDLTRTGGRWGFPNSLASAAPLLLTACCGLRPGHPRARLLRRHARALRVADDHDHAVRPGPPARASFSACSCSLPWLPSRIGKRCLGLDLLELHTVPGRCAPGCGRNPGLRRARPVRDLHLCLPMAATSAAIQRLLG